jgi:outer membrane lipoprotein SlyB
MTRNMSRVISVLVLATFAGCKTTGNRIGQTTSVQFGTVRTAEPVTLDSNAAKGALVGGTLGLMAGSSNSAAVNAIRGASVGGVAKGLSEGDRSGMAYTVEVADGTTTRIVTDQREIHVGDCVAVERVGQSANIRRASASYCDPANGQAVRALDAQVRSDATRCETAKQELAKASTTEAAELALRKADLLCDG